jgi:hypothetical protein
MKRSRGRTGSEQKRREFGAWSEVWVLTWASGLGSRCLRRGVDDYVRVARRRRRPAFSVAALLGIVLVAGSCSTRVSGPAKSFRRQPPAVAGTKRARPPATVKRPKRQAEPVRADSPTDLVPLPKPAPLKPFGNATSPLAGRWHAAGRIVEGHVAVYETTIVPPGSSGAAGIAWMDPRLLRAQLYSGSLSPGHGPWKLTAPISPVAARTLVAAFNGGFKFPAAEGGYYAEGRLVYPLRPGGASLVIYKNGSATVGSWGRDVTMTPKVIAVRQNLSLLVDGGRAVAGLNPYDTSVWGSTLGGVAGVWRSGLGVTRSGALVYVIGPDLEITQLAALLVRAGCVRAMTLDMNPDWTVYATYDPTRPHAQASPSNGSSLLRGTVQGPYTFFEPWWARDFITMSAR